VKPPKTENPGGWEVKLEKTFLGGGVWIFSGTTQYGEELAKWLSSFFQKRN